MSTSSVTIGLPFFNNSETLLDAVRSIFAQTYSDWELILVDDGSTDLSLRMALQIKDPRVLVLSDGMNKGLHYRLNQITSMTKTTLLARMDADDIMHSSRIETQSTFMELFPDCSVVGTACYGMGERYECFGIRGESRPSFDIFSVLRKSPLIHPTILGRTAWFVANPYDVAFTRSEDHELWVRTVASTNFQVVRTPLLFYREPSSLRLSNYLRTCSSDRKIFLKYGGRSVGPVKTAQLITQSYLKSGIYTFFHMVGIANYLVKRRYRSVTPVEKEYAQKELKKILSTPVPGIDC